MIQWNSFFWFLCEELSVLVRSGPVIANWWERIVLLLSVKQEAVIFPWQRGCNTGAHTCLCSVRVQHLTRDWVAVLWIGLDDWVCVCTAASRAATEAAVGWNPSGDGARLDFSGAPFPGTVAAPALVWRSVNITPQTACPHLFFKGGNHDSYFWFWGAWMRLLPNRFWSFPPPPAGLHRGTWGGLDPEKPQHEPLAFMLALGYVKRHAWELLLSHY